MNSTIEIISLISVGMIAGVVNTMAGGGSLLTLPVLIFLGLPPNIANATNRIGVLFQNLFTTAGFKSKGVVTFPFSIYLAISAFFGSLLGAQIAVDINDEVFNKLLAVIMMLVVISIVFKPKANLVTLQERLTGRHLWISVILFFIVGIYGGFIQAGVGFLMLFVLSSVNHISLVKSNAIKVVVALVFTISAVAVFAYNDIINWKLGLILAIGNSIGGWFASRWSVKKGDAMVKQFLVIMVIIMAIKLWFF